MYFIAVPCDSDCITALRQDEEFLVGIIDLFCFLEFYLDTLLCLRRLIEEIGEKDDRRGLEHCT